LYIIFDILFLVLVLYLSKISYEKKVYLKIFEYFKIFFLFTISAKLAPFSSILLQKLYITKADTYTTLLLIAFAINLLILFYGWKYIVKLSGKFVNTSKTKILMAKLLSFIEVLVLSTFSLYIVMQLYISKVYIYPHLSQTYTYKGVEKFYQSFLNDKVINIIFNSNTGTNQHELLFKSFSNSI
jgi:hypothetical protein